MALLILLRPWIFVFTSVIIMLVSKPLNFKVLVSKSGLLVIHLSAVENQIIAACIFSDSMKHNSDILIYNLKH